MITRAVALVLIASLVGCSLARLRTAQPTDGAQPSCLDDLDGPALDLTAAGVSLIALTAADDVDARALLTLPLIVFTSAAVYGSYQAGRCKWMAESPPLETPAPVVVPYRAPPALPAPPPRRCFSDEHCPEGTVCDGDGQCRRLPPLAPITL